jgi:hypothetical protein
MKRLLLILVLVTTIFSLNAQNVGIGTTNPNASAILDLNSTTRGFLLPRLTTSQMFNIQNPANGLLVFNSSYGQLYHYDGSTWRGILNATHWLKPIANRDVMSNTTDSVGIGVSVPTRRLDVNGTMRVRGTLFADEGINVENAIVANNFIAGGTGTVSGLLQTNDQIIINNASAILQMRASAVNKGFLQLNGDDVRIGTNSGNENGKFIIRNNGGDRLSVDKFGILNVTNKITSTTTGEAPITPLCWGLVHFETSVLRRGTANVRVERRETGIFSVFCEGITAMSCVVLTPSATGLNIGWVYIEPGRIDVILRRLDDGSEINHAFSFIIY